MEKRFERAEQLREDVSSGDGAGADEEVSRQVALVALESWMASSLIWMMARAYRYRILPAGVGSTSRPNRSNSFSPTISSSARTCSLTVGCVRYTASAALVKL